MLQIRPVQGRAEIRRFVDYMYERNASDPHWVPPDQPEEESVF